MNISLIYPILNEGRNRREEGKQYWPPLGLAYIAAFLEQEGHRIRIIDRDIILRKHRMNLEKTDNETIDKIMEFDSGLVGYSITTPHVQDAAGLSRKVRAADPHIIQIIGGPHCAGAAHSTMEYCGDIDVLVRGEGERTTRDIVSGKEITSIEGICYRSKGAIRSNKDRDPIVDLDNIPKPARHLLDMDFYMRPNRFASRNLALRTTSILTSRGCPYRCNYCAGPLNFPGRVRFHTPERIIDEITELVERYKAECLYFADDMFLSNLNLSSQILQRLIEKRLNGRVKWIAQLHPKAAKSEFLKLMKESGCVQVEYGFESGSQKVLELMNKKSNIADNLKVARLTRKTGIRLRGNFIVGYPGEEEEDFRKTMSFIKKAKPHQIGFHLLMPLPGTKVYEDLSSKGADINWHDMGDDTNLDNNYSNIDKVTFRRLYYQAYLTTLLPINIYYFLKDNIRNPFRILYIGLRQLKALFNTLGRALRGLWPGSIRQPSFYGRPDKQKIVMVAPFGLEPFGTVKSRMLPIARSLKSCDVSIVIPPIFDAGESGREYKEGNVGLYNIKVFGKFSIWQVPILTLRMIKKALSLKGDIIHVFKPKGMSGFVAMFFIIFGRRPVILDTDDLEGEEGWNAVLDYPVWVKKMIDFQEKWLASHSNAVTVASRALADKMREFGAKDGDIYYLPNSIENDKIGATIDGRFIKEKYGFKEIPLILLYTRFFEFDLNKIMDIAGCVKIASRAKFLIAGKGPRGEEFEFLKLAREAGLEDMFVYTGWLDARELAGYIAAADVVIHPYSDNQINRFKSPRKILEIMSLGKPVVVDGVGQNKEYIVHRESGFLADSVDTEEFSGYVMELLNDENLRKRIGENARNRVAEHFNWDKNVKILEGAYAKYAG